MIKNQKNFISNRINNQISSEKIRIVNKEDYPEETIDEVISKNKALYLKDKYEVDLIEIAVNQKECSSICKLIAKDKFLYQEKRKEKERKNNQKNADLKEVKLGVDIAENDFNTKLNHAAKFLNKGDNVKVSLQLRGRQSHMNVSKEKSLELVLKFADSLSEIGKIVSMPVWNNNKLTTQINSKIRK